MALPSAVEKSRLVTGFGAVPLSGPTAAGVVQGQQQHAGHVFVVNPAHPLLAAGDGAAGAHAERRQQLRQGAAFLVEHDADPHQRTADAGRLHAPAPPASQSTHSLAR